MGILDSTASVLAQDFADQMVMQDKSKYLTSIKRYMEEGHLSGPEAKRKTDQDFAARIGMAAVSGGVMGAGLGLAANAVSVSRAKSMGKTVMETPYGLDKTIGLADKFADVPEVKTAVSKVLEKPTEGPKPRSLEASPADIVVYLHEKGEMGAPSTQMYVARKRVDGLLGNGNLSAEQAEWIAGSM